MWIIIQELGVSTINIKEFEISAHNALLNLYAHCKMVACTFHLAQTWFWHIQNNK